jgi:osmotically-inducible protein OsmY
VRRIILLSSALIACRPHGATTISDASIGSAFDDASALDPILRTTSVHARVVNGDVTLTGAVSAVPAKNRAEELVGTLKGARSVVDQIVVNAPNRSDVDIVTAVTESIHGDPATRSANVQVTSLGQLVTLRGDVASSTQRELIADAASRVTGVRDIKLLLQIRGTPGPSEIAADVDTRLRDDARVDGPPVAVVVDGRSVTLSGVVGSLVQRSAVIADAWALGVASVDAHALRVDWSEWIHARAAMVKKPTTDASLVMAITHALADDVRVGAPLPTITADHGVVTLSGNVVDFRAARVAVRMANRSRGVQSVEDRLTVPPAKREDDATIQKQVEQVVYNDIAVSDTRNIQITTTHAKVTVQGHVASQEEKISIEDDIELVPGVIAIEDDVQIVGYGPTTHVASSATIQSHASESLFDDARIPSDTVKVTVAANGDATLTGLVDDGSEARAATDDAVRAGAAHIINLIRVRP